MDDAHALSESNSAEAIQTAAVHAEAIEKARMAQITVALTDALTKVFGDSDSESPTQMKVLVRRIPILCVNVEAMHTDLAEIKGNIKWAVRIVIGAVIVALLKLVLLP